MINGNAAMVPQFLTYPRQDVHTVWLPQGVNFAERIYFPTPTLYSNTLKVFRFELSGFDKEWVPVPDLLNVTVTLVDVHNEVVMQSMPLRRITTARNFIGTQARVLPLYVPFRWDPTRSYVRISSGLADNAKLQFVASYE